MCLRIYLTLISALFGTFCYSQHEGYSVRVTEKPFRFEVTKEGELQPLLIIDNGITLQHFTDNTIKANSPYFVWTKGKSDKKQIVRRAIETFKSDSLHVFVLLSDKNDSLFKFQYKLNGSKCYILRIESLY